MIDSTEQDPGAILPAQDERTRVIALAIDLTLVLLAFLIYTWTPEILRTELGWSGVKTVVFGVLVALVAVRMVLERRSPRIALWPAICIAAYYGVCALSLLFAIEPASVSRELGLMFRGGVMALVIVLAVGNMRSLRWMLYAVAAATLFLSILTVYQQATQRFDQPFAGFAQRQWMHIISTMHAYRAAGSVNDPNYFALVLLMASPVFLYFLFRSKAWPQRLMAMAALVVCGAASTYTYSRSGFIGAVVLFPLAFVLAWRGGISRINIAAAGVAIIVVLAVAPTNYLSRMASFHRFVPGWKLAESSGAKPPATITESVSRDHGFRGRLSEAIVAGQMFMDHPMRGVGLANYRDHYLTYAIPLNIDRRRVKRQAHSLYLEVIAETGVIGAVTFTALLMLPFRSALAARRRLLAAGRLDDAHLVGAYLLAMLGFCILAVFQHSAYTQYFWLMMGMGMATPAVCANLAPTKLRSAAPTSAASPLAATPSEN